MCQFCSSTKDGNDRQCHQCPEILGNDNEESENDNQTNETSKKPKRVLIFSHLFLLQLLAVCSKGGVDGTFKASPILFYFNDSPR